MIAKLIFSIGLLLWVGCPTALHGQQVTQPHFSNYPAPIWRGKVASLRLTSHPYARKFRTNLRRQLRGGVNFAGHYTVASAGCGTGCSVTAIIDAQTGSAYFPSEFDGWTAILGDYEWQPNEDVRTFRKDSRLLRVVGRPSIGKADEEKYGPSGIYFYDWKGNKLRLIKFIPAGSYPDADPE
jgi:hypothetical protein